MKSNSRIVNLLKQAKVFFFATVDGTQPNVRPFNAVVEYEDRIYFYTNNHKNAYKQMKKTPKVELCAIIGDDRWIRVNGEVVFDNSPEAKLAMLSSNPELKKIYNEYDKIFEVFYLKNMHAKISCSYSEAEVIC